MKVLAADTGQLLKETGDQTGQFIGQARADAQESLRAARARVADLSNVALAKTRRADSNSASRVTRSGAKRTTSCAM